MNTLLKNAMAQQPNRAPITLTWTGPYSIARMVWKRRALISAVSVALLIASGILIYRLPGVYRAEAVILVDSQKIPEKYVTATVQVSLQDSLSAIGQRVLNVNKLQSLIKDFHLYEDLWKKASPEELVARLRDDLKITLERGLSGNRSGAFRISYDGKSPSVVAAVVRRITFLFISENLSSREQRAEGTAEFIESQLQVAKKRLDEQEKTVSEYKVAHAGRLPQQEAALLGALGRLQAELQGNQDSVNRAQQNKILLESTLKFSESALNSTTRMLNSEAGTQQARAAGTETARADQPPPRTSGVLRARLAAMKLRYFDDHPEVKRLQAELDRVLAGEASDPAPAPRPAPDTATSAPDSRPLDLPLQAVTEINREKERIASTRAQLEMVNREIESRSAARDQILGSIAEYQRRVESLPVREQQMAALTRDYETSKLAYQSLLDKKHSATMATDMERSDNSERFTVADPAREPSKPVRPRRLLYLAAAALFGLAAGLTLALALELKKNQFLGEWELPANVRVLGRIPRMHPPSKNAAALQVLIALPALTSLADKFRIGGLL